MKKWGKWDFIGDNMFRCVECGALYTQDQFKAIQNYKTDSIFPDHCPNCDANMREEPWILCSEKLPKDGEDVLVWYEYFRYGEYDRMFQTYGIGHQYRGTWGGDVSGKDARCIAWMPLPKPYEGEE